MEALKQIQTISYNDLQNYTKSKIRQIIQSFRNIVSINCLINKTL